MPGKPTTRQMSDAHEEFLAALIGGVVMPGSGNQWARQMDARNKRYDTEYAFAADGKSTFAQSVGVSRAMWDKAVEQANGERAMLALRFYTDWRLSVGLDLIVVEANEFAEILEDARSWRNHLQLVEESD